MSLLPFDAVMLDNSKCRACEHEGPPEVAMLGDCITVACPAYREHHLHVRCSRCGYAVFMECSSLLTDQGEPQ